MILFYLENIEKRWRASTYEILALSLLSSSSLLLSAGKDGNIVLSERIESKQKSTILIENCQYIKSLGRWGNQTRTWDDQNKS